MEREKVNLRLEILSAMGGKCAQCGYGPGSMNFDPCALDIDHVNNDGKLERSKGLTGKKYYLWVAENLRSGKYQILCRNCNWIKERNRRLLEATDSTRFTCTKCNESKLGGEFARDLARPNGKDPYCKSCRKEIREIRVGEKVKLVINPFGSDLSQVPQKAIEEINKLINLRALVFITDGDTVWKWGKWESGVSFPTFNEKFKDYERCYVDELG